MLDEISTASTAQTGTLTSSAYIYFFKKLVWNYYLSLQSSALVATCARHARNIQTSLIFLLNTIAQSLVLILLGFRSLCCLTANDNLHRYLDELLMALLASSDPQVSHHKEFYGDLAHEC